MSIDLLLVLISNWLQKHNIRISRRFLPPISAFLLSVIFQKRMKQEIAVAQCYAKAGYVAVTSPNGHHIHVWKYMCKHMHDTWCCVQHVSHVRSWTGWEPIGFGLDDGSFQSLYNGRNRFLCVTRTNLVFYLCTYENKWIWCVSYNIIFFNIVVRTSSSYSLVQRLELFMFKTLLD